jgi:hypothetical protein
MHAAASAVQPARDQQAEIPTDRSMLILEYAIALFAAFAAGVLGLVR